MNSVEAHKNFKMGTEIDIAGIFIYDGMKELERIKSITYESEAFSFLYHIAVGIERLQKVLLVMLEEITEDNIKAFEKSLHTHSHQQLHDRIKNEFDIRLSPREYSFLHLLSDFYNHCRYDRYLLSGDYGADKDLLCKYIKACFNPDNIERQFLSNDIVITPQLKKFFGRIIGSIARRYYDAIREQAYKLNLYTYELRYDSPAQKIFLSNFKKDSLHEQNVNEQVALKEFIIYLINTQDRNAFMRFIKEVEPLNFDIALVDEYIEELCNRNIPQHLVDEVECMYMDIPSIKDRLDLINCVGNTRISFDYGEIKECYNMMQSLVTGECDCTEFAKTFPDKLTILDDDDVRDILKEIPVWCANLLNKKKFESSEKERFIKSVSKLLEEFKDFCAIHD